MKIIKERTPLILLSNDAVCLCKRPSKGLLAGLWEPPTLEGANTEDEVRAFLSAHGCTPESIVPLPHARHIFTHVEWHMRGYILRVDEQLPGYVWVNRDERLAKAIPSAFRYYLKILEQLGY